MSRLYKPGADGGDLDDPRWAQEGGSHRLVWHRGHEGTELEVRRRNTKANHKEKKERRRNKSKRMMTCWVVLWLLAAFWLIGRDMLFLLLLFIHVSVAHSCITPADKRPVTARRTNKKKNTQKTDNKTSQFMLALGTEESESQETSTRRGYETKNKCDTFPESRFKSFQWIKSIPREERQEVRIRPKTERLEHFFTLWPLFLNNHFQCVVKLN